MAIFENPLGYVGAPPNAFGTDTTTPSTVRAATLTEADAGTRTDLYISPATAQAATVLDFYSPPANGYGYTTPRPVACTTLTSSGNTTLATGAAATTIDLGNIAPSGARVTTIAGGNSAQDDTVNILPGAPSAGTQTVNILTGTATGGTQAVNIATTGSVKTVAIGSTTGASSTTINSGSAGVTMTGDVNVSTGELKISTAGKGLQIKEGANATMGQATLAVGTQTVATTAVTSSSRIVLTRADINGSAALGSLGVGTVVNATSFVINAYDPAAPAGVIAADVSKVNWLILEPL